MPKLPATSPGKGRLSRFGDLSWAAIEIAGGWAETSERLSKEERDELTRLRKKAHNRKTPLTKGERAKYTSLVVKGVGAARLREWFDRAPPPVPDSPREPGDVDAADRLRRAAEFRDAGIITDDDFQKLKARYLEEL